MSSVKCEYCGRKNDAAAELCKSCGAPMQQEPRRIEHEVITLDSDKWPAAKDILDEIKQKLYKTLQMGRTVRAIHVSQGTLWQISQSCNSLPRSRMVYTLYGYELIVHDENTALPWWLDVHTQDSVVMSTFTSSTAAYRVDSNLKE